MKYVVCDRCGSHLDYGETCDCEEEDKKDTYAAEAAKKTERSYSDYGKNELERACRRGA